MFDRAMARGPASFGGRFTTYTFLVFIYQRVSIVKRAKTKMNRRYMRLRQSAERGVGTLPGKPAVGRF
jgi:hypothetical protein